MQPLLAGRQTQACLPWAPGWRVACLPLIHGSAAEASSTFDLFTIYWIHFRRVFPMMSCTLGKLGTSL